MVGMTKPAAKELDWPHYGKCDYSGWIATEMSDKDARDIRENAKKQMRSPYRQAGRRSQAWLPFLASDAASYISGQTIIADGGLYSPDDSPAALCGNFPL